MPEPKTVAIKVPSDSSSTSSSSSSSGGIIGRLKNLKLPPDLEWIPANWTWSKIKPAFRSAFAAWISVVLFVIPSVQIYMGQASFLILIASFLSPPSDPTLAVIEREVLTILFVALIWAWSCLGIFLANLTRKIHNPAVTLAEAVTGQYIEAAPTVIFGVFLFLGTVFLLYVRARQGPGPYLIATILACICLDISLTTAVLFPFPFYTVGRAIIIPLGFHSVVAVASSILVFPSTVSAQFTTRLQAVLSPLILSLDLHRQLLQTPTDSQDFLSKSSAIISAVKRSEGALIPLALTGRLLNNDLVYSRFAPTDFRSLQAIVRRMAVRANGMTIYFTLIDPTREKFPRTPTPSRPSTPLLTPSRPGTPLLTPTHSRAPSISEDIHPVAGDTHPDSASPPATPTGGSPTSTFAPHPHRRSQHILHREHHHHHHHSYHHPHHHKHLVNNSLLHIPLPNIPKSEHLVGVFESQRYLDIETVHFGEPNAAELTQQTVRRLSNCCDSLLGDCQEALTWVRTWLDGVRSHRWRIWMSQEKRRESWGKRLTEVNKLRERLQIALDKFQADERHHVLDPYRPAFEHHDSKGIPPHRYLFHSYVYQYHLMRFVSMILEMLTEITTLEQTRTRNRIWTPVRRLFHHHSPSPFHLSEDAQNEEEDPDMIQGIDSEVMEDLDMPKRRDPDALPPKNWMEWVLSKLYIGVAGLGGGNALYSVKAGVLTVIMCIPVFLSSSAQFAYENKFVWAIIMAQLTLARFRGDTAFGLVARIASTFMGGLVGMVMWYIGQGNPYGLAAVCVVCFPFFFYARLYWTAPPMRVIIFFVTAVLVLGYSYQDLHLIQPGAPGVGFDVAWRRFVLVTTGVTAAFIFSFFPPSRTIRRYQRATLSTTITELGAIYCQIVSFAHSHTEKTSQEIITSLIAIRSKLNRGVVLKANAIYEFSFRGRWPAQRYAMILDLQLNIAYSLSHLFSLLEHLEPQWTKAFLRRTRLTDPNFQGDVLAVITLMATSLRTGTPLPQITPCPLLDRYMLKYHGLNVVHKEDEDDFGLPRALTIETLQNEQYLMFSVALATTFGIISRLDRLMVAVKEVVGEQYYIRGIMNPGAIRTINDLRLPRGSQEV